MRLGFFLHPTAPGHGCCPFPGSSRNIFRVHVFQVPVKRLEGLATFFPQLSWNLSIPLGVQEILEN